MESDKVFTWRINERITLGIIRNPTVSHPLRIYYPSTGRLAELNDLEINEIMIACLYVRRWGKVRKARYPWTTAVPTNIRLGFDNLALFGRLDRLFKSGKENMEGPAVG